METETNQCEEGIFLKTMEGLVSNGRYFSDCRQQNKRK